MVKAVMILAMGAACLLLYPAIVQISDTLFELALTLQPGMGDTSKLVFRAVPFILLFMIGYGVYYRLTKGGE